MISAHFSDDGVVNFILKLCASIYHNYPYYLISSSESLLNYFRFLFVSFASPGYHLFFVQIIHI